MIQIEQLSKHYAKNGREFLALDNIDLQIEKGEIYGIIGHSGAGKSTLIHCLTGLEKPSSGRVLLAEQDVNQCNSQQLRAVRRKIGMIFQQFNLLNSRTVFDNIALPLELIKTRKQEIATKVKPLLELTGLSDRQDHYPAQLSGGQKQRVAIARALVTDPDVLLSDEASSALDPETTRSILKLLKKINEQLGITIVMITHEMAVIKQICQRVALLSKGRVIEQAPVYEFFFKPKTALGRAFVQTALHYDIPAVLRQRLQVNLNGNPLIRIHYQHQTADQPIIANLLQHFAVQANILQANLDYIDQRLVGIMILELRGEANFIDKGLEFLKQQHILVEHLGHV